MAPFILSSNTYLIPICGKGFSSEVLFLQCRLVLSLRDYGKLRRAPTHAISEP